MLSKYSTTGKNGPNSEYMSTSINYCIQREYFDMSLVNVIQSMNILLEDNFKNIKWFIASELFGSYYDSKLDLD